MIATGARRRIVVRRALLGAAALVVVALLAFAPFAGRYLVESDPLSKSDVVFVPAGARVERWLEAVDLYKQGLAPVIVLSPGLIEKAETDLRDRGIRFPTDAQLAKDAIVQLGVPASAVLAPSASVDNTAQEANLLKDLAAAHLWRSAIIVTSMYHSRRTGFAFRRALQSNGVRITVHPSRYDTADPAHWWRRRYDIRYVSSEWQKLLAYRLGLSG